MSQTIVDYQKIKQSVPTLIDVSGYRDDFVSKKMGMRPTYFSVKKQRGTWTDKEVESIFTVLTQHNEQVEDYILLQHMLSVDKEDTLTLAEFKKETELK